MITQDYKLESPFSPSGDQPEAIRELCEGIEAGRRNQVLLGVTGSGKTFTMAKIIEQTKRPALIMAPNKILAAQLYSEMKEFFPHCIYAEEFNMLGEALGILEQMEGMGKIAF